MAVPREITVVVETPARSRNSYRLDRARGLFKLDRTRSWPGQYPGDSGFVPRTLLDSGNALDVLLLIKEPTYPGCIVSARPLGVFGTQAGGDSAVRIIAVPLRDPDSANCFDIDDIPRPWLREVESFFASCRAKDATAVQSRGWERSERAMHEIRQAIDRYRLTYLSYLEATSP